MIQDLYKVDEQGKLSLKFHSGQLKAWDSKKRFVFVLAGTQAGKGLALDTPVAAPGGFPTIGQLEVGDIVYDARYVPCLVAFVSDVHHRQCYEIEFDNGETVVADDEHRWEVWCSGESRIVNTQEIYESPCKSEIHIVYFVGQHPEFTAISSIVTTDSVPTKCIGVSSPDKSFLITKSCIATKNTSFGPWWLWKQIKKYGKGDYIAVTSTFPLLRLKMLPEFLRIFHSTLHLGKWWGADRIYELANPETGEMAHRSTDDMWGRVIFGSAKNADSLESATAKAAWLDEVGQNDFQVDSWEAVLRRLSLSQGPVLGTTTLYNWGWMKQQIYDPWKRGETDEIDVIQFRSIKNPSFPREEYYRAKRTMPPWKFKMFYEGLYDKPAGMIYDSFDFDDRTVIPPFNIPGHWPLFVGLDFGGVNMAGLFTAQDPDTKIFYHFNEYLAGGRSILQHANEFKKIVGNRPFFWVGGAAPEEQWRVEFREAGLPVLPPPITDVEVGIQRVYGYHRRKQIRVFNTMTRYLDQKGSYARELDDLNQPTEKIENKNTYHLMDAERVLFAYLWERQGGPSLDLLEDIVQATKSRWSTVRAPMIYSEPSGGGGRWQRGRKF